MAGRICRDCRFLADDYKSIAAHIRSAHGREPLPDRPIQVGDVINHNGVDCRVEELLENDNAMVRPIIPTFQVEYRVDRGSWQYPIEEANQ